MRDDVTPERAKACHCFRANIWRLGPRTQCVAYPSDTLGPKTQCVAYPSDTLSPVGREGGTCPLMAPFRTYEITIKRQAYRPLEVGSCLIDQFHFVRKESEALGHQPMGR